MAIGKKHIFLACVIIAFCVGGFFLYLRTAFPENRCEGAHLVAPDKYSDCLTCHTTVTPKVVQNWEESKHGVLLVKCVVCHGEPDGTGSVPFVVNPNPNVTCASCHDQAIQNMRIKYGDNLNCNSCHPNHQNSIHKVKAYTTTSDATKTGF